MNTLSPNYVLHGKQRLIQCGNAARGDPTSRFFLAPYLLILLLLPCSLVAHQTLIVQLQWKHQFEFAGYYAAIQQGFYDRRGLKVELREYQDNMDVIAEVLSGRAQYATYNSGVIQARLEGKPVVLLANYFKQMPMVILAQKSIDNLAELSGKRLMISAKDLNSPLFKLAFEQERLKVGENVQIVSHSFDTGPFIRGEVDAMAAFVTNEPFDLQLQGKSFNIIELSSYMRSIGDLYLFASEKYVKDHPRQIQHFIDATTEGWQYALDHKEEIVDLILKQYSQRKSRAALLYEAEKTHNLIMPLPLPIGMVFDSLITDVAQVIVHQQGITKHVDLTGFIFTPPPQTAVPVEEVVLSADEHEYLESITFNRARSTGRMPLQFKNRDGEIIGIIEDYWKLIRKKLGLKEKIADTLSFVEALHSLETGTNDIYPNTTYTKEREHYALFSDTYEHYPIAIVTNSQTGFISNTAALEGQIVAVGKDCCAYPLLKNRYPNIKFLQVSDIRTALAEVAKGNAYAAVDVLPVLQYHIEQLAAVNLKLSGVSDVELPLQVMVRKEHFRLLPLINRAIAAITHQERLDIYKKWMLSTIHHDTDYTLLLNILTGLIALLLIILYWNRQLTQEIKRRKAAEERLRTLSRAVEQSHNTIVITNKDAKIEFINPAFCRVSGYDEAEVMGRNPRFLKSGKQGRAFYRNLWDTITQGQVWQGEICNKRKDSSLYWEFATISPVKNTTGDITHYVAVKEDITQRKETERALQHSRQKYQRLVEDIGENFVLYSHRADGTLEYASRGAKGVFGLDPNEIIGKNWMDLIAWEADSLALALESTVKMASGERDAGYLELCFSHPDGEIRTVAVTVHAVRDYDGNYTHSEGLIENITERKHAEESLKQSEERYRQIFDYSPVAYQSLDRQGRFLEVNQALCDLLGYKASDLVGKYFGDFWSTITKEQFADAFTCFQKSGTVRGELELIRGDGTMATVLLQGRLQNDYKGRFLRTHCILLDINERKQTEEALRESEDKLRSLYELSPLGIALTDMEGHYIDFNAAFVDICGYPVNELQTLDYWVLTPPEYAELEAVQLASLESTGRYGPYEKEYLRKDGSRIPLRLNGVMVKGQDGQKFIWSLLENITEQKRYEAELRQAKETAEAANRAKSAFLANMSHELRTPLNAVLGYAQVLQQDLTLSEQHRQSIGVIRRSGECLLTLINDVLDLAKVEAGFLELFPHNFNLRRFFMEISDMFRVRTKEKGLSFHYIAHSRLPTEVNADSMRLRQICMNLLSNAIKFTEHGEIRLEVDYDDEDLIISVKDTGIGISDNMRKQIFKPFVQTGEQRYRQQGTGLGLAISLSLTERMSGCIELKSEPGKGSCFKATIPVPALASSTVRPIEYTGPVIGFHRTDQPKKTFKVLVVDDVAENRDVLRKFLEPLGFAVMEAPDGTDAVELTQQHAFDVILMDLVMPKMDGLTATYHILERSCTINKLIIAVTARAFTEDREDSLKIGCKDYLVKPVDQAELLQVLKKHLPLEWDCITPTTAPTPTTEIPLDVEQRKVLANLVSRGAIHEVIKHLENLVKAPDCPSEAHLLLNLANGFKLSDMRRILEK